MIDLFIALAILFLIFFVFAFRFKGISAFTDRSKARVIEEKPKITFSKKRIWSILGIIIGIILFIDLFVLVPGGHIACIYDVGRGILEKNLSPGLHLKIPFWQRAKLFSTRIQAYSMSGEAREEAVVQDEAIEAPTADGQKVQIDVTVLFRLDPTKAYQVWQNIGVDYVAKIIKSISRSQIRMVISRYTAIDIYSAKRQEAAEIMKKEIFSIFIEKGIILEDILLRKVSFTPEYAKTIEEKQIAEQKVKKAEYDLQRIEIEKKQKITQAQGEAEAIRLRGEKLKENPAVIQYEFVQKMADDIKWGILPSGAVPLLDLKEFLKEQ